MLNFILIGVDVAPAGWNWKYRQDTMILTVLKFWGFCTHPLPPIRVILAHNETDGVLFHVKFHVDQYILLPCTLKATEIWQFSGLGFVSLGPFHCA